MDEQRHQIFKLVGTSYPINLWMGLWISRGKFAYMGQTVSLETTPKKYAAAIARWRAKDLLQGVDIQASHEILGVVDDDNATQTYWKTDEHSKPTVSFPTSNNHNWHVT